MDENEKKQYSYQKHRDGEYEFLQIAEDICKPGNELKGVKIHDFQNYMNNEIILEHCARTILQREIKIKSKESVQKPVKP